jgi:uncharacterized repeat protein (TIGR03803 family)
LPAQVLTTLHSFSGSVGEYPRSGLVQANDGNFYGTTYYGGAYCSPSGCGTVFKVTDSGTLTTLYSFCTLNNCLDGSNPQARLIQATDGNLYGTTYYGGANNAGTVFKITPSGTLTTLHSFAGTDGKYPLAALVQATDGNFYGTTDGGGAAGGGTIFKITPSGALTTLYSFCSQSGCADGGGPQASLVQASDGNFYGTTYGGGTNNDGTVFKITPSGTLTTLHSFSGADGANPYAGLIQATDGNFYGTTFAGGYSYCALQGCGTIFKITTSGTLTTLYWFSGADGYSPYAGLVQGSDGNFYGTTYNGGAYCPPHGCGTVFKISASGMLTTLYSFSGGDGSNPYAGLIQATDGNFYGTTYAGAPGSGTVFKITPSGTLTTLHSVGAGSDGIYPYAGLVQGSDGNLYGTTIYGGAAGDGTVFKIAPRR